MTEVRIPVSAAEMQVETVATTLAISEMRQYRQLENTVARR